MEHCQSCLFGIDNQQQISIFLILFGTKIRCFLIGKRFFPDTLKQYNGTIEANDDTVVITRKFKQAIENSNSNTETVDNYELSERENEILTSVAKGMTNKEIADLHNISIHTVISHRKNITRKTGIKTVSGLTVYALLNNLIDQSDIE